MKYLIIFIAIIKRTLNLNKVFKLAVLLAGLVFFSFKRGKDSIKNEQNEQIVDEVEQFNKFRQKAHNMSNSALNKQLHKYQKPARKRD